MVKMIYRVLEIMPFGTNCYLVASNQTHEGMVIDPAGDGARIMTNIEELGLKISLVVVTHTHRDHIGAIRSIIESTRAHLAVHTAEAQTLQGFTRRNLSEFAPGLEVPPAPDMLLNDGDTLTVGDLVFQVLHTPGHSVGGICIAGYGVVFSGDTLFNMGIGRTDGPGGNFNQLISSIRGKLLVLPDQTVVLPGHGPRTTIGRERRANPFLRG